VTGAGDRAGPGHRVVGGVDAGRDLGGVEVLAHPAEPEQHLRRGEVEGGEGAYGGAELAHGGGGADAVAHHVPDHERDPVAGQRDHVVPVAAHPGQVARRQVAGGDLQAERIVQVGREQAALQRERGAALPAVQPRVVDAQRGPRGELLPEGDVLLVERRAAGEPVKRHDAEHPAARLQRHHEQRDALEQPAHVVAAARPGQLLGEVGVDLGEHDRLPARHAPGERRPRRVRRHLVERPGHHVVVGAGPGHGPRQAPHHGRPVGGRVRQLAVDQHPVPDGHRGPVGEPGHGEVDELTGGLGDVEGRADAPARLVEEGELLVHRYRAA